MAATAQVAAILNLGYPVISTKLLHNGFRSSACGAPAAIGAFQRPCLGRFRQGAVVNSAPSKFQPREARLQGYYRSPALPCL